MNVLSFIILFSGIIMLARSALFWLYFIQTRHYRLDRIWSEMKQRAFWRLIFSLHRVIVTSVSLGLIVTIIYFINLPYYGGMSYGGDEREGLLNTAIILSIAVATYIPAYAIMTITVLLEKRLKLPKFTAKSIALLLFILTVEGLTLQYFNGRSAFNAAVTYLFFVIETMQPFIVLGVFALAYTPNIFLHRFFISRAKEKISAHKNLIVIGITGSYGKTTTKEFLAHILSKKYKVLKTPAHINVDTGVAKVIRKEFSPPFKGGARGGSDLGAPTPPNPPSGPPTGDLPQGDRGGNPEIFIVEMGAYKKGEIKKICELVHPQYAVMTGLSDQHLALFGSPKAIAEAKFELVEAVSGVSGHIVANADSAPLVAEFKRRRVMPVWYGEKSHATRFKPTDIVYSEGGTSFMVHGIKFQSPAVGTAALNNLLGAITVAVELGLHLDEIAPLISDLPKIPATMELKHGENGTLFIDDTYNANTEGVLTALADLENFKRTKKIFVFSEVIELGERTSDDHALIAQAIGTYATHAFLLPSRMTQMMRAQLIEQTDYTANQIIQNPEELKKLLNADTVVLFEGRDAAKVLNKISSP